MGQDLEELKFVLSASAEKGKKIQRVVEEDFYRYSVGTLKLIFDIFPVNFVFYLS